MADPVPPVGPRRPARECALNNACTSLETGEARCIALISWETLVRTRPRLTLHRNHLRTWGRVAVFPPRALMVVLFHAVVRFAKFYLGYYWHRAVSLLLDPEAPAFIFYSNRD